MMRKMTTLVEKARLERASVNSREIGLARQKTGVEAEKTREKRFSVTIQTARQVSTNKQAEVDDKETAACLPTDSSYRASKMDHSLSFLNAAKERRNKAARHALVSKQLNQSNLSGKVLVDAYSTMNEEEQRQVEADVLRVRGPYQP